MAGHLIGYLRPKPLLPQLQLYGMMLWCRREVYVWGSDLVRFVWYVACVVRVGGRVLCSCSALPQASLSSLSCSLRPG